MHSIGRAKPSTGCHNGGVKYLAGSIYVDPGLFQRVNHGYHLWSDQILSIGVYRVEFSAPPSSFSAPLDRCYASVPIYTLIPRLFGPESYARPMLCICPTPFYEVLHVRGNWCAPLAAHVYTLTILPWIHPPYSLGYPVYMVSWVCYIICKVVITIAP